MISCDKYWAATLLCAALSVLQACTALQNARCSTGWLVPHDCHDALANGIFMQHSACLMLDAWISM
jgi:hypothetical protein